MMRTERATISFGGTTLLRQRKYTVLLAVLLALLVFQSFTITTGSESIGHDVMATIFAVAGLNRGVRFGQFDRQGNVETTANQVALTATPDAMKGARSGM